MAEIRFYHTQYKTAQDVLPDLLLKALSRQMRVICKLRDAEACRDYDDYLWQYSKSVFLPHGMPDADMAEMQPVLLTTNDDAANKARTMMVIDDAELPPNGLFDLVCLIFDGRNPLHVNTARAHWSRLKQESDVTLTYWQQQENGQWQNKA